MSLPLLYRKYISAIVALISSAMQSTVYSTAARSYRTPAVPRAAVLL